MGNQYSGTHKGSRLLRLCMVLVVVGCSRHENPSVLVGQWHLEMTADSMLPTAAERSGLAEGHVVFHHRIREHSGALSPLKHPYVVGRYYADLSGISARVDSRSPQPANDLDTNDLDLLQEIIATTSADTLRMIAAPRIIGTQITFEGTIHGDSAAGTWRFPSHHSNAYSAGRFRMMRVENLQLRDSAIARSRRSTRADYR